ncbi:hypothetical protein CH063_12187 [Colletotrichum higginsianum]|uniref:Uncharacterized protein n=1 Tax=Colletotrichum higginsianum (strain IMI 349063) TaxID=759273 RepID=H1VPE5_COLHI|nr:hypothetical protein CH063_12187 [Colletotrichum higginsianum]
MTETHSRLPGCFVRGLPLRSDVVTTFACDSIPIRNPVSSKFRFDVEIAFSIRGRVVRSSLPIGVPYASHRARLGVGRPFLVRLLVAEGTLDRLGQ